MTNPCRSCDRLKKSKNHPRCRDCRRRQAYLGTLEQAPGCLQDPCYAMAYSLPRSFARQLGPVAAFSQCDLLTGWF